MKLEVFLARRYLSSHRGRGLSAITWIALFGVIVGVMSLVAVLSVMSGFERELRQLFLGNNAHIVVQNRGLLSMEELHEEVEGTEGVESAMPVLTDEAFLLGAEAQSEAVLVKGVEAERLRKVLDLDEHLFFHDWEAFEQGGIFVGSRLASRLRVDVGDSIVIMVQEGEVSPFGLVPRRRRVKIADVFQSGLTQFDSRNAFLPLPLAEGLFDRAADQIEVRTEDSRMISQVRESLVETVGEHAYVDDWLAMQKGVLSALRLEKLVMGIILGFTILVAAFNICGSLIMVVRDKTRDIAILKSMGAGRGLTSRIFFLQGFFIGAVGTGVGLILGVLASWILGEWVQFPLDPQVYMIDQVPVDLRYTDLLWVTIGALGISCLATLYPARLAANLIPTEGLKAD